MQNKRFLDNNFFNCLSAVGLSYPGWLALRMMAGFENFPAERIWGYVPLVLLILSLLLVTSLRFVSQAYDIGYDDRNLPLGLVMVLGGNVPLLYLLWLLFWSDRRRRTHARTI